MIIHGFLKKNVCQVQGNFIKKSYVYKIIRHRIKDTIVNFNVNFQVHININTDKVR